MGFFLYLRGTVGLFTSATRLMASVLAVRSYGLGLRAPDPPPPPNSKKSQRPWGVKGDLTRVKGLGFRSEALMQNNVDP